MKFRHRRRGRKPIPCRIPEKLDIDQILPVPIENPEPIYISQEELIVLKYSDLIGKSQENISVILCISRPKVSRLLSSARKKIVQAIFEKRPIKLQKRSNNY